MRSIIQRIATGTNLSKNISIEVARAGQNAVLAGHVDPVEAGTFLSALRMTLDS